MRSPQEPNSAEAGAVTAEFAVALPAVIFVLGLLLGCVSVGVTQLKVDESARVSARAVARGESAQAVQRIAHEVDASVAISITDDGEFSRVSTSRKAPGIIGELFDWTLHAEAVTPSEKLP